MQKLGTISAVAATLMACSSVMGQATKPMGLSVGAGVFFPSSSAGRAESKNWFIIGADYQIKSANLTAAGNATSTASISVDYSNKGSFQNLPVMVNITSHNSELYYKLGVGFGFARIPNGATTDSSTNFMYSLGGGYNFEQGRSPLFVEARYLGCSKADLNGFAVMVGVRL